MSSGLRGYRRRRLPAGTIFRPSPERRLLMPGSRVIGTLLASATPAGRPAIEQESGGVWGSGAALSIQADVG